MDFYGYEAKIQVPGTVVDEIFIVTTVNLLKHKITSCGVVDYQGTDEGEGDDIILGYIGTDLFVDTQVGTCGSCVSWIFGEHENLSGLRLIWFIQSYLIGLNRKVAWAKNLT